MTARWASAANALGVVPSTGPGARIRDAARARWETLCEDAHTLGLLLDVLL
jgi:hypothetical protein